MVGRYKHGLPPYQQTGQRVVDLVGTVRQRAPRELLCQGLVVKGATGVGGGRGGGTIGRGGGGSAVRCFRGAVAGGWGAVRGSVILRLS